jgi:hypothetical protein
LGREKDGVGDGFKGFEEIEGFGAGADEGVTNAVALCKNEEASRRGFIQRDSEKNETTGGKFFVEGGEFGELFGAGGTPCGPEVEEKEFSVKGGCVVGLIGGKVEKGKVGRELEGGGSRAAGAQEKERR